MRFTWEYGSDLRLELASIRKSEAFSIAANDFGISDFIFKSWEELIVSRPTLDNITKLPRWLRVIFSLVPPKKYGKPKLGEPTLLYIPLNLTFLYLRKGETSVSCQSYLTRLDTALLTACTGVCRSGIELPSSPSSCRMINLLT